VRDVSAAGSASFDGGRHIQTVTGMSGDLLPGLPDEVRRLPGASPVTDAARFFRGRWRFSSAGFPEFSFIFECDAAARLVPVVNETFPPSILSTPPFQQETVYPCPMR
jgi:hypothetical protein